MQFAKNFPKPIHTWKQEFSLPVTINLKDYYQIGAFSVTLKILVADGDIVSYTIYRGQEKVKEGQFLQTVIVNWPTLDNLTIELQSRSPESKVQVFCHTLDL
jgi:hypothetical protein